jgi:PD-(D/E)XK endonuclease
VGEVLTTNQKGVIAEAKIAAAAVEAGIGVARPLDDERYDLIFDLGGALLRVQCKWAVRRGDVVAIACRTNRRGPNGYIHTFYEPDEIDLIAAYCADTARVYLLPPELSIHRYMVQLRLTDPRNNQRRGIHHARDFEFEATLHRLRGPIAQLGERRDGIAKAAGSSPAGSTPRQLQL